MRLLHNMSQPPRTRVVVAPDRKGARGLRLDLSAVLPPDGPRWHARLCAALGVDPQALVADGEARPEPGESAEEARARLALVRATERVLRERGLPAALPLWEGRGRADLGDPLLAVAILSRASARTFLARRTPRFDRERLSRALVASENHLPPEVRP